MKRIEDSPAINVPLLLPNDESRAFSIRSRSLDVTEGWLFAPQRILIIVVVGTDETRGESRDADETHREKTKEEERGRKGGREGKRERETIERRGLYVAM